MKKKGKIGHFGVRDEHVPKLIDTISRVSKNPAFDLLTQAIENANDAVLAPDVKERVISVYPTSLYELPSLVVEDTGTGMDEEMMENYRDIMGSMKKWHEAAGFYGIGRFAYIARAYSGVFIETHYMDGSYDEWAYAFADKIRNECTFRSEFPDYEHWDCYSEWLKSNSTEELTQGTRILMWNVDKDILNEIDRNGKRWIATQFGDKLDDIELYFKGEKVEAKAPPHRWYKTISGDKVTVEGNTISGQIYLCRQPLDDYGIAVRAVNRTICYTMFDLVGYERIQPRIWGWIDANSIITKEMLTPAKDEIIDNPTRRELWKKMRDYLRVSLGEWEERLEASRRQKIKGALKEMRNRFHKTLKALEQTTEMPIEEEEQPPHPELAKKDDEPLIERDGWFLCSVCGKKLSRKPDKVGIITSRSFLKTPCPHCGNPYKLKAHQSALGKNYRLYICKHCRHHILQIDRTRFGFDLDVEDKWTHDPELEFIWESKLLINGQHTNFIEADRATKKLKEGKGWRQLTDKELDNTPIELYILNCVASGYALTELGKQSDTTDFIKEISKFKTTYYSIRISR